MSTTIDIRGYTLHVPEPGSNVGWVRVGEVFILFGRAGKAPEERMNAVFDGLRQPGVKTAVGASVGSIRLTSVQRRELSDCIRGMNLVTVNDHNPIARGIITALGWFGLKIKAMHWHQIHAAVEAIDPEEASAEDLEAVVRAIQSFLNEEPVGLSAAS